MFLVFVLGDESSEEPDVSTSSSGIEEREVDTPREFTIQLAGESEHNILADALRKIAAQLDGLGAWAVGKASRPKLERDSAGVGVSGRPGMPAGTVLVRETHEPEVPLNWPDGHVNVELTGDDQDESFAVTIHGVRRYLH
nr:hypothetical protein [Clavibacter michiganensis]